MSHGRGHGMAAFRTASRRVREVQIKQEPSSATKRWADNTAEFKRSIEEGVASIDKVLRPPAEPRTS